MKVKIINIHQTDAFYENRDVVLGLVGDFKESSRKNGFVGGEFLLSEESQKLERVVEYANMDNNGEPVTYFHFYRVQVEEVE